MEDTNVQEENCEGGDNVKKDKKDCHAVMQFHA